MTASINLTAIQKVMVTSANTTEFTLEQQNRVKP